MFVKKFIASVKEAFVGAGSAVKKGLGTIKQNPQILIYPYLAALFILVTLPLANGLVFKLWDSVAHGSIFTAIDDTPRSLHILVGLVSFSLFYTIFVSAYFTCAMSADVLAKLEGRSTPPLYGLRMVGRNFLRVSKFALLAIFFFPISIFAQRHRLNRPKGGVSVIGSSLSLNMSQLAPVILTKKKSLNGTIRQSVDTLGSAWRQNLVIKIGMYGAIFLLVSASFLPKLVEDHWFNGETAHIVGVLTGVMLTLVGYVVTKVIGSVFTATLYYQASRQHKTKPGAKK